MKYTDTLKLSTAQFKRLTGVHLSTFQQMLEVLLASEKPKKRGRPCTLSLEDQLLLTLSYWRDYRTLFQVGVSFGISESSTHRIVQKVEDTLIKSDKFQLPKKPPQGAGIDMEVIMVDVTEIRIERPKKTEKIL